MTPAPSPGCFGRPLAAALALVAAAPLTGLLAGCGGGGPGYATVLELPPVGAAAPASPQHGPATDMQAADEASPASAADASGAAGAADPVHWQFARQPVDVRAVPGEAASFHVQATGGPHAFEYQWLRDGEPIEGATTSQYSFVATLDDGGATFSVRVRPRGAGPAQERESAPATLAWRDDAG